MNAAELAQVVPTREDLSKGEHSIGLDMRYPYSALRTP